MKGAAQTQRHNDRSDPTLMSLANKCCGTWGDGQLVSKGWSLVSAPLVICSFWAGFSKMRGRAGYFYR